MAAQLTATNGPAPPRAQVMNRARDEFFAGAALAVDQYGRFAGRDLPNQREHLLHRGRRADQIYEHALVLQLALQALGFFGQAGSAQTPARAECEALPAESAFRETRTRPDRELSRWRFRYYRKL